MLLKPLFLSLLCLFIFGCKENETTIAQQEKTENEVVISEISKKDIQSLKFTDYRLSNAAMAMVSSWQKYQELSTQLEYLNKADLTFYSGDVTLIATFLNDFKAEIPSALATNEIHARITVLETKMLKLNSLLVLDNISKNEKLQAIKELLVAHSNLNLQINKKLEFDTNNISKPQ